MRSSQESHFQNHQSIQEKNFATSVAFHDLETNKRKDPDNVFLSSLNISFENFTVVPCISETNINEEFPNLQFFIENYDVQNRKDRNKHDRGLIEFVRKGLI